VEGFPLGGNTPLGLAGASCGVSGVLGTMNKFSDNDGEHSFLWRYHLCYLSPMIPLLPRVADCHYLVLQELRFSKGRK